MRNKLGLSCVTKTDVPPEQADKFLSELANVPHYDHSPDGPNATKDERGIIHVALPSSVEDAWRRIYNLFPDLLPKHGNPEHERRSYGLTDAPGVAWEDPDDPGFVSVGDIPPKLRLAWTMPMKGTPTYMPISLLATRKRPQFPALHRIIMRSTQIVCYTAPTWDLKNLCTEPPSEFSRHWASTSTRSSSLTTIGV